MTLAEKKHNYGFIEGDKIFLKAWGDHADREIGLVKEDVDSSISFFEDRFTKLNDEISQIESKIEDSKNKGSFLEKLKHIFEDLPHHSGLGDYLSLHKRISTRISQLEELISSNRNKNFEIKSEILRKLEEIESVVSWKESSKIISDLRQQWIRTGTVQDDMNQEMEQRFWSGIDTFEKRKKSFFEDKKKLAIHYESIYKELVDEAKHLRETGLHNKKTRIDDLRDRWKSNGPVNPSIYKPLIKKFNENLKSDSNRLAIDDLLTRLERLSTETIAKEELEKWISSLKSFLPKSKEEKSKKATAFDLIGRLREHEFINAQCLKRHKDFSKMSTRDKLGLKVQLIRKLIDRDKKDLELYKLNVEKFSSPDNKITDMMTKKITQQKRKIEIKESLLKELRVRIERMETKM